MHRRWPVYLLMLTLSLPAVGAAPERQRGVAERGARVMPFDLERTLHVFAASEQGGIQRVVARDPADAGQVALIRAHLQEIAGRFRRGDFGEPRRIHGADMPGLAELAAGASRLDIRYVERPDGAEIHYRTQDPALVAAVHRWFDAQVSDHGRHASPDGHHGHGERHDQAGHHEHGARSGPGHAH